ncbi:MAG TPA: protein kinase [Solirubrobacteraceae bacterium]|nr:protein kinase [Solirubrobacteraceae bacterium]
MPELEPGDEFAGCRIEGVAGRGGMGVVYRATELSLGRPVALKLLAPERARDQAFRDRFQRESRMAAAIDHPNVIPVYAAGEHDGSLYLVMRYVGGTDLHALLRERGALEPELAAELVGQVASALDAAHAAGLVHRDVKPANVLLAGEHAYLSDFGLTRLAGSDTQLTQSGQWIGTVEYCSPEQLRGERTDARADVYSLGCVLHAALTGRPPFAHGTVPATMHAHLYDDPAPPSERGAPREFDRVVARALAKDPAHRYPSTGDLGRAVLAAARGERVTESERSVAVGSAAPQGAGNGDVTRVIGDEELTAWDAAAHEAPPVTARKPLVAEPGGDDASGRRVVRPRRWPARAAVAVAAFAGLVAVGLLAGVLLGDPGGASARTGPLSEDEVRDAAQAFGDAYEAEDPAALRRTLARDVLRVLPGGRSQGREQVVDQYARQFDGKVEGYDLADLDVRGGRAGRASGSYRVDRDGGDPYEGRIVFGVVRERGQARIALIAATPRS